MNLTAIALLCHIAANNSAQLIEHYQLECQKEYVTCWNKKRKEQLLKGTPYDGERFLGECVLEK